MQLHKGLFTPTQGPESGFFWKCNVIVITGSIVSDHENAWSGSVLRYRTLPIHPSSGAAAI